MTNTRTRRVFLSRRSRTAAIEPAATSAAGGVVRARTARAHLALLASGALASLLAACGGGGSSNGDQGSTDGRNASAHFVATRSVLVGGDRALGDIGDILMQNERIRLVIQREGYSRGFGVYGGSLIDADLRRPDEQGSSGAGAGYDQFAELFPAFFVQAVNVDEVKILDDGSDSGVARVQASGVAGDFLELVALLNRAVTGSNEDFLIPGGDPQIRYSTEYELQPNKPYVTIRFRVQNIASKTLRFPSDDAIAVGAVLGLDLSNFTVPIGDIALFGATTKVFFPGVGFDIRFGLERAYQRPVDFPAFPGFAAEFVASRADQVSYGLIYEGGDRNYTLHKRDVYEDGRTPITRTTMFVPFVASSFVGLFYEDAPRQLLPGESCEVVKHFIVGSGDVGSIVDVIHDIRGATTGRLGGQVFDAVTGAPSVGTSVLVYQRLADGTRRIFNQYDVHEGGNFGGTLEPGPYSLKVVGDGRQATDPIDFEISAGRTSSLRVESAPPGRIVVQVFDDFGVALPAKATAIGTYGAEFVGMRTPEFLFDLAAGEAFRSSDAVPDAADDPRTREFIETHGYTNRGIAELLVRPGEYDVVSSRGPEYDTRRSHVSVRSGETASVRHGLMRVVDTRGWVAMDAHVHSRFSIDSGMDLDDRVRALAAEGVEVAVATDHNYVTDYAPVVARNDLTPWIHPIVGLEMTTLESGHFNGYPLRYEAGKITNGSFAWARRTPGELFAELRARGSHGPQNTIVQVNHPRDDIIGYFNQYRRDGLSAEYKPPAGLSSFTTPTGPAFRDASGNTTYSGDFDAMELANGKLYWEVRHYRVPEQLPPGNIPPDIPPAGTVLVEEDGDVAFPGAVDDWFNLLNLGYKYIGVGTGDSHSGMDEPGQFRTMVQVGVDAPDAVRTQMVVDALRARRAITTNGPLLDFWIDDARRGAMGQTLETANPAVSLTYTLTAAPWISLGRVNVYRNGVIAQRIDLDDQRDLSADPIEQTLQLELATAPTGDPIDSWFVVEAIGYRSMYPVVSPLEIPPLQLTDALASLAGPLGLANDEFGDLRPPNVFPVTAYAITNPVWVTTHAGDFAPPGVVPLEVLNRPENDPQFMTGVYAEDIVSPARPNELVLQSTLGRIDLPGRRNIPLFYPHGGDVADVRKILGRLGALAHHGAQ